MTSKSPTTSVKSREIIGVDAFSQRREVFDKHDTVFLPLPSPTGVAPVYREVEPIVTSNHGKTTSNFKRNTATSSSMRESSNEERYFEFRSRKYSDNFTSELNQSEYGDYRYSAMERTRRLSKMRKDFLTSNLHEPEDKQFSRSGTRSSLPAGKTRYKIESPNLYKFPFAEPYASPSPVRRVVVDLGPAEAGADDGKENQNPEEPELRNRYQSLPDSSSPNSPSKIDHQKLFEELVKRYSPQRKPIDWTLPPTKPRVVASVPKSTSSVDKLQNSEENPKPEDDDVFEKKENSIPNEVNEQKEEDSKPVAEIVQNGPESVDKATVEDIKNESEPKLSLSEEEKNDRVPELHINNKLPKKSIDQTDLTIPELVDKMTEEGEKLESTKTVKKVKRKRSFLDKLLGRKRDK